MKFIDICSGIGGFRLALERLGHQCVFSSEIDKHCIKTYEANFGETPSGDITKIEPRDIPEFDILCAGFPCQPFSWAGKRKGIEDERGNIIWKILHLISLNIPSVVFLENVPGLFTIQNGMTFYKIKKELEIMGYTVHTMILNAKDFGIPQNRKRLYIVATRNHLFFMPLFTGRSLTLDEILGGKCDREIAYTLRVGGRSSGLESRHNWDSYIVDGVVKKLTIEQAKKLQGLPDDFIFPVSETQAFKQLGNSVCIPVIETIAQGFSPLNEREIAKEVAHRILKKKYPDLIKDEILGVK